jgi:DNA end-binding protein Ku
MPLWKGHISFGLVSVPVSLVAATERGTTPLHMIHTEGGCLGRIRYRKVCELDEQTLTEREIGRGYETPSGAIVPVTDEDLDSLPIATARTIELVAVLPADRIDTRQIGAASYYLAADDSPAAAKPYVLIARALARRHEAAIVRFAVRGDRERLGMLRPVGSALALNALRWSDEVHSTSELPEVRADVNENELTAALGLIDSLSADQHTDIPDLVDHYARALDEVIEAKREGHIPPHAPSAAQQPGQILDLMAALQESVTKAKASRGEDTTDADVHELPKKTAAKKNTAAKKAATSKSTASAKKATGRRPRSA